MKKKLQLILIDSDKPQESGLFMDENFFTEIPLVRLDKLEKEHFHPKHLYAVSNEDIQEGDYFVNTYCEVVYKAKEISTNAILVHKFAFKKEKKKKIAITTDVSLEFPTFTNEFLDLYVKAYNEGEMIQEVEVEYDCDHSQIPNKCIDILKVNPDNTVNVKVVNNKTYTVAEVIEILYQYEKDNLYFGRDNNVDITHEWIKKNLI